MVPPLALSEEESEIYIDTDTDRMWGVVRFVSRAGERGWLSDRGGGCGRG